jgi:hypothetical protein
MAERDRAERQGDVQPRVSDLERTHTLLADAERRISALSLELNSKGLLYIENLREAEALREQNRRFLATIDNLVTSQDATEALSAEIRDVTKVMKAELAEMLEAEAEKGQAQITQALRESEKGQAQLMQALNESEKGQAQLMRELREVDEAQAQRMQALREVDKDQAQRMQALREEIKTLQEQLDSAQRFVFGVMSSPLGRLARFWRGKNASITK